MIIHDSIIIIKMLKSEIITYITCSTGIKNTRCLLMWCIVVNYDITFWISNTVAIIKLNNKFHVCSSIWSKMKQSNATAGTNCHAKLSLNED